MRLKKAFTLIELLVVIAIIAILAAIIFPVFARAKDAAYRSGDIANMNALRSALQLYRIDQGGYPPALLGYVTTYTPGGTDTIPANLLPAGYLYPKRIESINIFKPAYNKHNYLDTTTAFWPTRDLRPLGQAPIVDTDGDGKVTVADDKIGARQAYGPLDGPVCANNTPGCAGGQELQFYAMDGYDVSENTHTGGPNRFELRYSLFFSNWSIGPSSVNDPDFGVPWGNGSSYDDPRQLGYSDPPETTPVTWNDYFRDYNAGQLVKSRRDIVLFLGGGAKAFASNLVDDRAWRIMP
jgi:prepilin-type N-terminal cleavage/methylation domain-containing protein